VAVAVVTDSTSDIDPTRAGTLGVDVVPLCVLFGSASYRDYVDLSRDDFFAKLAAERILPTTSQPPPALFEEIFARHAQLGDEVLCIVISSKLSGTINAARTAAAACGGARIEVVDSQTVAAGLCLQVEHARDLAADGATMDEILGALATDRESQRLFAAIPDLSHAVRTGRVGKAQAALGNMLKIVPLLTLKEGAVAVEASVRTFARAQQLMIDATLANRRGAVRPRLMITHTRAAELAARTAQSLAEHLNLDARDVPVLEGGPVIATHAGPGAVGVFSVR